MLLEVLAKMIELLKNKLILLLGVVLNIVDLLQRKLNVHELIDVVLVNRLRPEEFNARYPFVPLTLALASKVHYSWHAVGLTLLDVVCEANIEVIGALLHQRL